MRKFTILLVAIVFLSSCAAGKKPEATPVPFVWPDTQIGYDVANAILDVCNLTMADLEMAPAESLEICVAVFNESFANDYADWPWPRPDQIYDLSLSIVRNWTNSPDDVYVYKGECLCNKGISIGPINESVAGDVRRTLERYMVELRVPEVTDTKK
jgi:hypothetical protein